jgi:Flp pilus assembly pilin Flp
MVKRIVSTLKKLHRDERGAEGLEKLLIVAAIVLPLLGLLIIFRNEIRDWVVGLWKGAKDDAGSDATNFSGGKLQ